MAKKAEFEKKLILHFRLKLSITTENVEPARPLRNTLYNIADECKQY